MSVSAVIRAVLAAHPLEAGDGREAGFLICHGCHLVLGNPSKHLGDALVAALDPPYTAPVAPVTHERREYRESYQDWEGKAS